MMGWWLRRGFRDGHVGSHKELWWIVREVVVWAALKSNFAGVTDAEGIRSASDLVLFERASAVVSRRRDAYRNSRITSLQHCSQWGVDEDCTRKRGLVGLVKG